MITVVVSRSTMISATRARATPSTSTITPITKITWSALTVPATIRPAPTTVAPAAMAYALIGGRGASRCTSVPGLAARASCSPMATP
jgi:hypothetical protein